MSACCVFSIAAENRFLSHLEVKQKMLQSSSIIKINLDYEQEGKNDKDRDRMLDLNLHEKEQLLQKHDRFLYSEKVCLFLFFFMKLLND
jgi:hypothetical protein